MIAPFLTLLLIPSAGRSFSLLCMKLACAGLLIQALLLQLEAIGARLRLSMPIAISQSEAMGGPLDLLLGRSERKQDPEFDFDHTKSILNSDALGIDLHLGMDTDESEPTDLPTDLNDQLYAQAPVAPVRAARITSHFGPRTDPFGRGAAFHGGIDFAAPQGTLIRASGGGRVTRAEFHKDYGNVVAIDHGNNLTTLYAHNHALLVRTGDSVYAGQDIARLGSTGRSTGPHLHFEVRRSGTRIDPRKYLNNPLARTSHGHIRR